MSARFEEVLVPSTTFSPGHWAVTKCFDGEILSGIDLGWRDDPGSYRSIGIFAHEAEAMFAVQYLESVHPDKDVKESLEETGFAKHSPQGLSTGSDQWVRQIEDGTSAWLQFDLDGVALFTVSTANGYQRQDVATLLLHTQGTRLDGIAGSYRTAAGLLCALLASRVESGDGLSPLA